MGPLFNIGLILLLGYLGGLLAAWVRLPRIVGYLLVGILLEPGVSGILPAGFISGSGVANDFALAVITFAVGGSLAYSKIKQLGKSILWMTVLEAELAFVLVAVGMALVLGGGSFWHRLPLALLLAALASPTDPAATLAVKEEYRAEGPVIRTVMGIAASDDALGIMNFSLATAFASALILGRNFITINNTLVHPFFIIFASIALGAALAAALTAAAKWVRSPGALVVIVLGTLFFCYGGARYLGLDELLSTMVVGIGFVNFSERSEEVFSFLSKYFEELIFIVFFVLAGAHLAFGPLAQNWLLVLVFVLLRAAGKFAGAVLGARIAGASENVRRYAAFGLLPQGGIVVGLAVLAKQDPHFQAFGTLLVSLIVGTTVFHELLGPLFVRFALFRSGEASRQMTS